MRLGWPPPALPHGYGPDLADLGRPGVAPPEVMAIGGHAGCRNLPCPSPITPTFTASPRLLPLRRDPVHMNTARGTVIPREVQPFP